MRIAYAGAEGAFGHAACLALRNGDVPIAETDFPSVIAAVERGVAERGMLPLRNVRAGHVREVVELLSEAQVDIVGEIEVPVRMHLLGLPTAETWNLRMVTSHPVALRQCALAISLLSLPTSPASNTAIAARDLCDPTIGVLASETAARAYGLKILQWDLQDDPNNATTFAVIERRPH